MRVGRMSKSKKAEEEEEDKKSKKGYRVLVDRMSTTVGCQCRFQVPHGRVALAEVAIRLHLFPGQRSRTRSGYGGLPVHFVWNYLVSQSPDGQEFLHG